MTTTFASQTSTPSADRHNTANDYPPSRPVEAPKLDATQIIHAIERGVLQVRRNHDRYEVLVGPDVVMSFSERPCVCMPRRNEVRVLSNHRSPVIIEANSTRDADLIARTLRHRIVGC